MRRPLPLAVALVLALAFPGCSGEAGPTGPQGPAGPTGPQGPAGSDGTASVSGVSPLTLFVDHGSRVTVSGSATGWSDGATLDFGPGIEVVSTLVASPSAIVAEVVADTSAALGPRSISVTDGAQTLTFSDAFSVESALALEAFVGTFTPGATVRATVRQMDPTTPFEAPTDIVFDESGLTGSILSESTTTVSATWDIPFTTASGRQTLTVTSPGAGGTVTSRLLPALHLPAPTATELPIATSTPFAIDEGEGSVVVEIAPPAGKLVTVSVDNVSPASFAPFPFNLIGPDSTFSAGSQDSFYAVGSTLWHLAIQAPPDGPYSFEVTADTADVVVTPMTSFGPDLFQVDGEFVTGFEEEFYSFTAEPGDDLVVGVDAGATDPCSAIDADVEVLRPDGSSYGRGRLSGYRAATFGSAEVAGTYFVRLRSFGQVPFDYQLVVRLN